MTKYQVRGGAGAGPVNLGGAQHGHRGVAVEQDPFGRGLIGPVALPAAEVRGAARRHGRGGLRDRRGEVGWLGRIDVSSGGVGVDRLAGDHHGGAGMRGELGQAAGVVGGEAQTVHQQVDPGTDEPPQRGPVVALDADEPHPGLGEIRGKPRAGSAGQGDAPPGPQQPFGDRPPDHPAATKDHRTRQARASCRGRGRHVRLPRMRGGAAGADRARRCSW